MPAAGDWSFDDNRPDDYDSEEDGLEEEDEDADYLVIDDDADVDESCDTADMDNCSRTVQQVSGVAPPGDQLGTTDTLTVGWMKSTAVVLIISRIVPFYGSLLMSLY